VLLPDPVIEFRVDKLGERGLIGITIDPNYESNGHVWVYLTAPTTINDRYIVVQRVVRFTERDNVGSDPIIMLEVPYLSRDYSRHVGGRLRFDDDGYLYVSMGDNADPANSQNLETFPGKIHRFAVEGDELVIPEDNPWPDNSAFAIGLRNPIDFVFDPYSDAIFGTENGPTCDDEVNRIVAGGNYGWREDYDWLNFNCDDENPGQYEEYIYPLVHFTPAIAPVGIGVYSGDLLPNFQRDIFFCAWNDGKMRRLALNEERTEVIYQDEIDLRRKPCHTAVMTGPDDALYFASSTAIYRIVDTQQ
jgi:glucose/arabinose dehydrogenase